MKKRDPAKIAQIQATYYARHREKMKTRSKAYYAEHKEACKAYRKAYRERNRDKINAYKRGRAKFRIRAKEIAERLLAKVAAAPSK